MNPARSVPYNQDAEVYVLGSVFLENELMNGLVGKIGVNDFYDPNHRIIYQALVNLYKEQKSLELITVEEEVRRMKTSVGVNLREYIVQLIDAVPAVAQINLYVNIIMEKAVQRELLNNMREISDDILTGSLPFNQLLDKTEDRVQDIIKKRRTTKILTIEKAARDIFTKIEGFHGSKGSITGISTGFSRLNRATLGFQRGELTILAARPSVGKSAFALNLAVNASKISKAHVAFFSLEMSIEQLMMRLFSYTAILPMSKIRTGQLSGEELILLAHARDELSRYPIYFDESNATDIYDIRAKCRELKQTDRLDLVVIDYLQLITTARKGNRQEEVASISRSLKILAKELDVPIVALSQLSRSVEVREEKRPVLSDLRESGGIEQDADIVMFLYRPGDAKKRRGKINQLVEAQAVALDEGETKIELLIAKNRQGALTDIEFKFTPSESRFKEEKYVAYAAPGESAQGD